MAILKIYSDIMDGEEAQFRNAFFGGDATTFPSVQDFLSAVPEDDKAIDLRIHCRGGDVVEGWAIYDALRGSGKEITATIEGECSSMATVVLLAAPKERRRAYKNVHICVHNPEATALDLAVGDRLTAQAVEENARRLAAQASMLREEEERILALYAERTGTPVETLREAMEGERMHGSQWALDMGFVSEVLAPITAHRGEVKEKNTNPIINNQKEEEMKQEETRRGLLGRIVASIKGQGEKKIVALVVTSVDGQELTIDTETGFPEVGQKASPDGVFTMEDGSVITVEGGVITAIDTPVIELEAPAAEEVVEEEKPDEEKEALKKENEELKARVGGLTEENEVLKKENEELKSQVEALDGEKKSTEEEEIIDKVKALGGMQALEKVLALSSHAAPVVAKNGTGSDAMDDVIARAKQALADKIEKRKQF